jgi:hypothetical protein
LLQKIIRRYTHGYFYVHFRTQSATKSRPKPKNQAKTN